MGNPVIHFEIAGPDGPVLQQFYSDLFGWDVQVQGPELGNYGVVMWTEGGIGGGIIETTEDMPVRNYVTFYIQVDDLQAAPGQDFRKGWLNYNAADGGCAGGGFGRYVHGSRLQRHRPLHHARINERRHSAKERCPLRLFTFELGGSDAAALEDFYTQACSTGR